MKKKNTIIGIEPINDKSRCAAKCAKPDFIKSSPRNIKLKPMRNLLNCDNRSVFRNTMPSPPMAIKGMMRFLMSSLKPINVTSQPVKVVPMLAPNIMPTALCSPIIPAPVNDITKSVTIELLCSTPVTNAPDNAALAGLPVCRARNFLKDLPARRFSASSSIYMPKRNNPRPASKGHISISL